MLPILRQRHTHRRCEYDVLESRVWTDGGVCVQGVGVWIQVRVVKQLTFELNRRH